MSSLVHVIVGPGDRTQNDTNDAALVALTFHDPLRGLPGALLSYSTPFYSTYRAQCVSSPL